MKIGIDIRSVLKQKTGIGFYTSNLVNYLAKIDSQTLYFLYSHIKLFNFKKRLPKLPGPKFYHKVDRFNFQPGITMKDMDVFQTSSYDIPKFKPTKIVNTIHDIIPLVYHGEQRQEVKRKLEFSIKKILNESDFIVTNSNTTKKDLEKKFAPIHKRIEVIYPGRDESLGPIKDKKNARLYLRKKYGIDKEFILFVGTIEKRKNVKNLIHAFSYLKNKKHIPHLLVVVGMKADCDDGSFDLTKTLHLGDKVIFTGYINRKDMAYFYNTADLFVYPSLYEGFGLPIIEAFSCGTPTVTSSTTSCGEVAGNAAVTIDPQNINELKDAMYRVLNDKSLRKELAMKGLNRAQFFSWEKAARKFKEVFYEVSKT